MDTNDATAVKRNARATLSRLYDARVADTTARIDPMRARANAALKDVDKFEVEKLDGQWGADSIPKAPEVNSDEMPMLTLRQLMPGSTGDEDEDRELDLSFRADRIEFIVVQRPLNEAETNTLASSQEQNRTLHNSQMETKMDNCTTLQTHKTLL